MFLNTGSDEADVTSLGRYISLATSITGTATAVSEINNHTRGVVGLTNEHHVGTLNWAIKNKQRNKIDYTNKTHKENTQQTNEDK